MTENKDIPQFVACGLEMGNCGYQIPYDMAEHERIIRADAIDEFADWVLINFAPLYTKEELINCFKEQLKEKTNE